MAEEPQPIQKRGTPPTLGKIAATWQELPGDEFLEMFPGAAAHANGWGSPFCFRCGWSAPTKKAFEYPDNWKDKRAISFSWNAASGWLERSHLQDHLHGGDLSPLNLVPLCVLCHEEQRQCKTRDEGLAFVRSESPRHDLIAWLQLVTDLRIGDERKPGKAEAIRKMLRAQADLLLLFNEAVVKTLKEVE